MQKNNLFGKDNGFFRTIYKCVALFIVISILKGILIPKIVNVEQKSKE